MNSKRPCSLHVKGEPLYVDDATRLCPFCPEERRLHRLIDFAKKDSPEGILYSDICRHCVYEQRQLTVGAIHERAVTTLTNTLSRATRRKAGGPTFGDLLDATCKPMGGQEKAFVQTGKLFKRVLRQAAKSDAGPKEIERGIKVGTTLLNSAASCEKSKGDPVDLSDLTEEELRDILMEPARQLILSDQKFRQQLLNDPEIRKLLLSDAGVELIEMEAIQ